MKPNFGSAIWDLLMEPLTEQTRDALKDDITAVCTLDPRVSASQIDITEYPSGFILEITLSLVNSDQSDVLKLTFDQQLGLVTQ
jgi:hypothetical protein